MISLGYDHLEQAAKVEDCQRCMDVFGRILSYGYRGSHATVKAELWINHQKYMRPHKTVD